MITAKYSKHANWDEFNFCIVPMFRVFGSFSGQELLQDKLEKKGTSPKTWYWALFQTRRAEVVTNQNDPAENERNRRSKFLQFLENFSGVYPWGEGPALRWNLQPFQFGLRPMAGLRGRKSAGRGRPPRQSGRLFHLRVFGLPEIQANLRRFKVFQAKK